MVLSSICLQIFDKSGKFPSDIVFYGYQLILYNFQRKWPIIEQSNNEIKPKWSTITHAEYSLLLKMILFQLEIELSYQKCIHLSMNPMFFDTKRFS